MERLDRTRAATAGGQQNSGQKHVGRLTHEMERKGIDVRGRAGGGEGEEPGLL
jgi:hypothetical protein